jgi:DNA-3-methyladenine glycosylase
MRPRKDPLTAPTPPGGILRPIPRRSFERPTAAVARALLGQWIVQGSGGEGGPAIARLVETEAYVGRDRASHAFRGPTPRNRSMFGAPGNWYVYRIHQVHCANVVTRPGEAVLLRAAEALTPGLGDLSGPGRLARGFGLTRSDDGRSAATGRVRLIAAPPPSEPVIVGPRVGLRFGTRRRLRYALQGVTAVSGPRPPGWARKLT